MANVTLTITVKRAWWVPLYVAAAILFARSIEPFLDLDDNRLEDFIDRQAAFVVCHGYQFSCNGKRV
jgi:hypothetical protein